MPLSESIRFLKAGEVKGRGSARQLFNDPSPLEDLGENLAKKQSRDFFQTGLSWEGPVLSTQRNIISGVSSRLSPRSSAGALAEQGGVGKGQVALFSQLPPPQKLLITEGDGGVI